MKKGVLHVSHVRERRERAERSVLVLFVDCAHEGPGRRQHLVDKDKDGLFRCEFDPFPDHVDKLCAFWRGSGSVYERPYGKEREGGAHLTDGEIGGDEVLFLVDGGDVTLVCLFADDLSVVRSQVSERVWLTAIKGRVD